MLAIVLGLSVGLVGCAGEEAPQITEYTLDTSSTEGGQVSDLDQPQAMCA